jgi:uncharacterized membrane protein
MKQLRSYQLAVVGSVLAMFSGCLGLPIGIWSLIVLSRREVREAFKADGARPAAALGSRARTGFTGWKIVGMVVVLMLLVTGILIFLVAGDCYLQQRNATPKNSAGTVHTDLARELLARGKLAEATEQYQEALRLAPDDARAHQGLANVLARMGRREEAIQQLREAVRLKPDYEQAKERLRELETSVKSSVGAKSQSQAAFGPGGVTSSAPPAAEQELSSGPAITRVVAGANKAVVEGRGSPDVKLVIRNGKDGYLTCGFLNDSPFTATIERATWGRGINCVVKDLRGNVLLTLGNGKVGPMTTERGRIVFREGTLASEPDGSFILGEFRPETGGAALPITVRLKKLGTSSSGSAIERVKTPPPDADQAKPGEPTEKEPSVR